MLRAGMGNDPSLVVYDAIGGGVGDVIGYEEGREAAQPFDVPTPVDAINAALVDEMFLQSRVKPNGWCERCSVPLRKRRVPSRHR